MSDLKLTKKEKRALRLQSMQAAQAMTQDPTNGSRVVRKASIYSGPLPAPETLAAYEQILPGAADRVIAMAERQSAHRQQLETMQVESASKIWLRGQVFGFILLGSLFGLGFYLILHDKNVDGFKLLIAGGAVAIGQTVLRFLQR